MRRRAFQTVPQPGGHWAPTGKRPHEYMRAGTMKILTLFNPQTGQVRLQSARQSPNTVLHAWLKAELLAILAALPPLDTSSLDAAANRTLWQAWQRGLSVRFTLPEELPPLRLLLVWDNLAGHKTPALVVWLCRHGIMPLYTPLGGSWLNMAESIQRILKRRALGGQHPQTPEQIGEWFGQTANAWNRHPTPFTWHGKRWQRRRSRTGDRRHRVGGSAAYANRPVPRRKALTPTFSYA